jgi:hypothetical protein
MVTTPTLESLPDSSDLAFRTVYVSGPMTGIPDFNRAAFNAQAARLRALGFEVENPAESPHCDSWQAYMRLDIARLMLCDWILMLPGWEWSRGAKIEHRLAEDIGLLVVYAKHAINPMGYTSRHEASFIEAARQHWDQGFSAAEVASRLTAELGRPVTKGVISGITHRHEFTERPSPIRRASAEGAGP